MNLSLGRAQFCTPLKIRDRDKATMYPLIFFKTKYRKEQIDIKDWFYHLQEVDVFDSDFLW